MEQQPIYFDCSANLDAGYNKITSVADPECGQDAVNLRTLNSKLSSASGVVDVSLQGTLPTAVKIVKFGAYFITVSPKYFSGLAAVFSAAKSSYIQSGHVVTLSSSRLGNGGNGYLNLTWNEEGIFYLNKTCTEADGTYTLTYYGTSPGKSPSPPCSISFCVQLNGTTTCSVATITFGSFNIAVVPCEIGSPIATFTAAKSQNEAGHTIRQAQGRTDQDCLLTLMWAKDGTLSLAKTTSMYDGCYKVNLCGFGC